MDFGSPDHREVLLPAARLSATGVSDSPLFAPACGGFFWMPPEDGIGEGDAGVMTCLMILIYLSRFSGRCGRAMMERVFARVFLARSGVLRRYRCGRCGLSRTLSQPARASADGMAAEFGDRAGSADVRIRFDVRRESRCHRLSSSGPIQSTDERHRIAPAAPRGAHDPAARSS